MRNLIRANIARMMRDKVVWILMAAALVIGLIALYGQYKSVQENGYAAFPESSAMGAFVLVGIVLSRFAPLFIGTEYSDGAMRNKIAVGAKRAQLYLSNFITCAIAGLLIDFVYIIVLSAVGFALLGAATTPIATLLIWGLVGILLTLSWAAIFTLITMLITNKAVSAIFCLLLAIVALMVSNNMNMLLHEPEFYDGMVSNVAGAEETAEGETTEYSMQYVKNIPNPKYVPPEQRPVMQAIVDILPVGQAWQITNREVLQPWLLLLYSAVVIVLANGLGILVFRRKDLK